MTQVENYKNLLEGIFNQKIEFSNKTIRNNCIGALMSRDNFTVFKTNFIERLKRINNHFQKFAPHTLIEIVKTAKQIGQVKGYKWSGSYSELVALDYWIQFENITNIRFPDRGSVDHYPSSIAKQIGQKEIDIDLSLDLHTKKIYSDVKSLIPTHTELSDQILTRLRSVTNNQDFLIEIDGVYDVDYLRTKKDFLYELQNGALIEELKKCVESKFLGYQHKLQSGANVSFRIAYEELGQNIILMTTREYDPYKLANDYKYKILDYYNKLLITQPSLITFVINTWFNNEFLIPQEFIATFLRSLARRVFMELKDDHTDMGTIFPDLVDKHLKISDVATRVTGIIVLIDKSINSIGKDIYEAHIYLNPNARNKVLTKKDFDILSWSPEINQPFIDDFSHDNY